MFRSLISWLREYLTLFITYFLCITTNSIAVLVSITERFMKTPVAGSSYKTTQQSTGEFEECNAKQQLKLHILEPDFN